MPSSGVAGSGFLLATDSYLECELALAVNKKDPYTCLADLVSKRIGVVEGSYAADCVKARTDWPDAVEVEYCEYETVAAALSDLQARNIDGVIADDASLAYYTRVMYYREHVVETFSSSLSEYSMYVAPGNEELARVIDDALADMRESGKYQEIYDAWFNVDEESSNPDNPIVPPQDQAGFVKGAN